MQAVYIPEDDRCTDILGLVEDEDNLRYASTRFDYPDDFLVVSVRILLRCTMPFARKEIIVFHMKYANSWTKNN
jgi:hypothetical protein